MAYIFSHKFEVYIFFWHARSWWVLLILSGCVVANQAVYFCLIIKIKRIILPSISCMAACATSLVADGADSVVVYGRCALAVHYLLLMALCIGRRSPPGPVGRFDHVGCLGVVATQALFCHLEGIWIIRKLHMGLMIWYMLKVTPLAVNRAFGLGSMAFHALLVVGRL